jgi:hypothetical protein
VLADLFDLNQALTCNAKLWLSIAH